MENCFVNQADRMDYPRYKALELPIRSGIVQGACHRALARKMGVAAGIGIDQQSIYRATYNRPSTRCCADHLFSQETQGGTVVESCQPYPVDAEIGRLSFSTYQVHDGDQVLWTPEEAGFPALGPREYYHTVNLLELALA